MGIFSFSRQNRFSISDDWKVFSDMFPNIGCFVYREAVQTAFFDENAQRIFGVSKSVFKEEYDALMKKLRQHPVPEEQNLYLFQIGAEKRYLRMQITRRSHEEIGFLEEMTNRTARKIDQQTEYDAVTNMLTFPAFSSIVQKKIQNARKLCIAALRVTGLDKTADFSSARSTDDCMASVGEVLNRFHDEKIIFAVKSFQEFFICFVDTEEQGVMMQMQQIREAVAACRISDDFGQTLVKNEAAIDLHAGLAFYPSEGHTLRELITYAEFALFETQHDSHHAMIRFSVDDFERKKDEYQEEQRFNAIIKENQLSYHFQPIIEAHTGEIIGYEMLMRTEDFSPEQMIALAEKYGRLYEIEKATVFNAARFLSENQNRFSDRKLFINSIPTALLSESDFAELRLTYQDLFEKIVIEIIEQSEGSEQMLNLLKQRCQEMKCQLAIDDYGSGYANTGTLLKNMPQYVKIDIELISGICKDPRKQQLVAGIIDYAHENQITVLAEGVEEEADLKMLIRMGVDLIQGFFTARPKPYLLEEISKEIRDMIVNTNLENSAMQKKIYHAHQDKSLNLVELALQNYTDIHIYQHQLTIIGDPERIVPMHIAVMENHSCEVRFQNVNMICQEKPCISIGNYAQLTLIAEGKNQLNYTGIRVPEGTFFHLTGEGDLRIDCNAKFGYGIGGDCESSYGCITLESSGRTEIICNSDRGLGIGGGLNPDDSDICLESGKISVEVGSPNALGIGCCEGNSLIYANPDSEISVEVNGISGVGMGSFSGETHIRCNAPLSFRGSGTKVIGLGVLNKGEGDIIVSDIAADFFMRSNFGTCIGAIGGEIDITVKNCSIKVNAEGGEITGIGDARGSGNILLDHTELKAYILAAKPHEAFSKNGKFNMKSSSIIADINDQHNTQGTGD